MFTPDTSKERIKSKGAGGAGGISGGNGGKNKTEAKKKRERDSDDEQSVKTSAMKPLRKKHVVKESGGGGGGGGAQVDIRGPFDYDGWATRNCTTPRCTRLDFDPVSVTYATGSPCGGHCKRSDAYRYCQANNMQYHKFPDGKFYDPEKHN